MLCYPDEHQITGKEYNDLVYKIQYLETKCSNQESIIDSIVPKLQVLANDIISLRGRTDYLDNFSLDSYKKVESLAKTFLQLEVIFQDYYKVKKGLMKNE